MLDAMVMLMPNLPGTAMRRGIQSRRHLDRFFRSQLDARRNSSAPDLFTTICRSSAKLGLGDDDLVDNMIGLLVASYETTASAISMTLVELAHHPSWQQQVREELSSICVGGSPRFNDLDKLTRTEWMLKEILRLYPPLPFIPRAAVRDFKVEGHTIPKGASLTIAPRFIHQMESIYPEPEQFDPVRFSPERAEDKAHPCAWVPFGKGSHTCMGMHFARLEIKSFLQQCLGRLSIKPVGTHKPRMQYVPVYRPKGPLPIRFEPLR